ncbi:MAG: hypothetical protein AABX32_06860 [Nanoarchaeota archaeon]
MVPAIGIRPVLEPVDIHEPLSSPFILFNHCRFISVAAVFYSNYTTLMKEHVVQLLLFTYLMDMCWDNLTNKEII